MISDLPSGALNSFTGFPHLPSPPPTSAQSSPTSTSTSSKSTTSSQVSTTVARAAGPTQSPEPNPWNHMGVTTHHAIIASGIIGLVVAVGLLFWFLCYRRRRAQAPPSGSPPGMLPLYNLHAHPGQATGTGRRVPGADAPPSYEEVVPPHLRVATGPPRVFHAAEGDDGVVADGKMPLSEIPFEDIVLEPSSSSSSASSANQNFESVHHNGIGDTRGHTNT